MQWKRLAVARLILPLLAFASPAFGAEVQYFDVPKGDHPHDVAPAPDGTVWYTGQRSGVLGRLDPRTGEVDRIPLGEGSAPHGVIIGPDGAAWVTDSGLNAIVRVDPASREVKTWPLPKAGENANLNTLAFDRRDRVWFTGQSGIYGRLDPRSGEIEVWDAPKGVGPYGITATPEGAIYYVSLAGSFLGRPDLDTGATTVIEPKSPGVGTRRVWSDKKGRLWVSEWNAGNVSVYDPASASWEVFKLPGAAPHAYAVYVDGDDKVWVSDFAANAILELDPETKRFASFPSDRDGAAVRQLNGRKGEVWGAESGTDRLVVIRTGELKAKD
ncbi:virginiamycin B lyase family protein [Methyloceanibacter sp.]|uniref:Vgb family protein n=1 Tax=Methyloceanibacter sp. TaxID=1965321 RepID=UPI002D768F37|nr:lyase [Methyloceanibacter sp.]